VKTDLSEKLFRRAQSLFPGGVNSPVRAFHGGSEGTYVVGGKRSPGSMYAATGGGTGMVWYYGTSGIMAGNALVTLQPGGSYSGPIWFFDRKGNTTDTGTVTVTFK